MLSLKKLCVGDIIYRNDDEFDVVKPYSIKVTVIDVLADHAIGEHDGIKEWLDDDTLDSYSRVPKYNLKYL